MTDVETKTPTKRKGVPNAQGKKGPAKKVKLENIKTPQKGVPAKQQNKNKPNSAQKFNKKNKKNSESENDSPKKLKPFPGTQAAVTKEKMNKKEKVIKTEETSATAPDGEKKKKRRTQFHTLQQKAKQGDVEVLKSIESKIKDIQNRNELTKTAKRKLKRLSRLKKIVLGEPLGQPQQKTVVNSDSTSNKGREKKKNSKNQLVESSSQKTSSVPNDVKANGKPNAKKAQNKKAAKAVPQVKVESEDEDEEESGEEEEQSGQEDSGEESDNDGEELEEEESDEEEEGESEDDSEQDSPPPPKIKRKVSAQEKSRNKKNEPKPENNVNLNELKQNDLVTKNQKRFVLFVGNIPYDTTKQDLMEHFQKSGEVKHIRIPTEKKSTKPRGFAYLELANEESYQRCLSMHHTFLKGRRINVLYTQGGKKKGEDKKKEIKAKNFKLHAMRKQGQLAGSKKQTQKRSFRRAKQKAINVDGNNKED